MSNLAEEEREGVFLEDAHPSLVASSHDSFISDAILESVSQPSEKEYANENKTEEVEWELENLNQMKEAKEKEIKRQSLRDIPLRFLEGPIPEKITRVELPVISSESVPLGPPSAPPSWSSGATVVSTVKVEKENEDADDEEKLPGPLSFLRHLCSAATPPPSVLHLLDQLSEDAAYFRTNHHHYHHINNNNDNNNNKKITTTSASRRRHAPRARRSATVAFSFQRWSLATGTRTKSHSIIHAAGNSLSNGTTTTTTTTLPKTTPNASGDPSNSSTTKSAPQPTTRGNLWNSQLHSAAEPGSAGRGSSSAASSTAAGVGLTHVNSKAPAPWVTGLLRREALPVDSFLDLAEREKYARFVMSNGKLRQECAEPFQFLTNRAQDLREALYEQFLDLSKGAGQKLS